MKGIKTESTTIEDVQDRIDKLVLGIFEAARGHNDVSTYQEKATTILSSYNQAIAAVNSLVGIEKTKEQQDAELAQLAKEYEETRLRVLSLEESLRKAAHDVDVELEQLLTDEVVGLKKVR